MPKMLKRKITQKGEKPFNSTVIREQKYGWAERGGDRICKSGIQVKMKL